MANGDTRVNGHLPINTDGGCLAYGEPIGASGLRQVCENIVQLRGAGGQAAGSERSQDGLHPCLWRARRIGRDDPGALRRWSLHSPPKASVPPGSSCLPRRAATRTSARGMRATPSVFVEPDIGGEWRYLHKKGWLAYNWPGTAAPAGPPVSVTSSRRNARWPTPRPAVLGLKLLRPVICRFGTEKQKREICPHP